MVTTGQLTRRPLVMRVIGNVEEEEDESEEEEYVEIKIGIEMKELVLGDWQVKWANKAENILMKNYGYIDTSNPGSGKTFIVLWLARIFGFKLLIICPKIVIGMWTREAQTYGVEIINILSYQKLCGKRGKGLKHLLLNRIDTVTAGNKKFTSFTPSETYNELLKNKIMLICDEFQMIKNDNIQHKSCNALISPIIKGGGQSRFGLISGTPLSEEDQIVNLLRIIGYIKSYRLYNNVKGEITPDGLQELIDSCRSIDAETTNKILSENVMIKSEIHHICFLLYINVVKSKISGAMPTPTNIVGNFDVANGFYNIEHNRARNLQLAIGNLERVTRNILIRRMNAEGKEEEIIEEKRNLGAITNALVEIEKAKAFDIARVAKKILTANIHNKVIICINYINEKSGFKEIKENLINYTPLILIGEVKNKDNVIHQFNNNPTRRLLIMNTAVGGVGISLHDTVGTFPRFMLISPNYKLLNIAQAANRIYRYGTLSDATVRMFYGKGRNEIKILQALARGTKVLQGMLEEENLKQIILPGDYISYIEP